MGPIPYKYNKPFQPFKKLLGQGWRNGLLVKKKGYSSRSLRLNSQNPQLPTVCYSSLRGLNAVIWPLWAADTQVTHRHTCWQKRYTHLKKKALGYVEMHGRVKSACHSCRRPEFSPKYPPQAAKLPVTPSLVGPYPSTQTRDLYSCANTTFLPYT